MQSSDTDKSLRSRLKIAYVWDRGLPTTGADAEQALNTIAALCRRGAHVRLIMPRPVGKPGPSATFLCEHYRLTGHFEVQHVAVPLLGALPVRKTLFAFLCRWAPGLEDADLVYTRNSMVMMRLVRAGFRVMYDTHRAWPSQLPWARPAFRAAMSRPNFLGVATHSDYARKSYIGLGVDEGRLRVMFNGHDPTRFATATSEQSARAQLDLPQEGPLVIYTGHITALKGLQAVLALAKRCPEALFLMVGSEGSGLIEHWARGRKNVRILGWQTFEQAALYMRAASVLLLPPSDVPLRIAGHTILPLKTFGYLAAGRPILGPDTPDVAEVLTNGVNASLVEPGNIEQAAAMLRRILSDRAYSESLGRAALDTSRSLTWDARAEKLEAFISQRLQGQPG